MFSKCTVLGLLNTLKPLIQIFSNKNALLTNLSHDFHLFPSTPWFKNFKKYMKTLLLSCPGSSVHISLFSPEEGSVTDSGFQRTIGEKEEKGKSFKIVKVDASGKGGKKLSSILSLAGLDLRTDGRNLTSDLLSWEVQKGSEVHKKEGQEWDSKFLSVSFTTMTQLFPCGPFLREAWSRICKSHQKRRIIICHRPV